MAYKLFLKNFERICGIQKNNKHFRQFVPFLYTLMTPAPPQSSALFPGHLRLHGRLAWLPGDESMQKHVLFCNIQYNVLCVYIYIKTIKISQCNLINTCKTTDENINAIFQIFFMQHFYCGCKILTIPDPSSKNVRLFNMYLPKIILNVFLLYNCFGIFYLFFGALAMNTTGLGTTWFQMLKKS